jgi:hypothetical protein
MEQSPRNGVPSPLSRKERSDMGIFTKDIKSMEDLLIHGLQDIYYAEQQILKSVNKRPRFDPSPLGRSIA